MDIWECPSYTGEQRDQILDGDPDPWGVEHLCVVWRDLSGHVVAREGDQLVAHAGWVGVDLRAGNHVVRAVGLGSVLVRSRARGRGIGKTIVRAAMTSMRRTGRPAGLLFCGDGLVPFYQALGWVQITDPVEVDQPAGKVIMPMSSCWVPLQDDATLPMGPLAVDGLPF